MPQAEGTSTSPTPQRRSRPAAAPRFAPTTTSTPQVRRACAAGQARSASASSRGAPTRRRSRRAPPAGPRGRRAPQGVAVEALRRRAQRGRRGRPPPPRRRRLPSRCQPARRRGRVGGRDGERAAGQGAPAPGARGTALANSARALFSPPRRGPGPCARSRTGRTLPPRARSARARRAGVPAGLSPRVVRARRARTPRSAAAGGRRRRTRRAPPGPARAPPPPRRGAAASQRASASVSSRASREAPAQRFTASRDAPPTRGQDGGIRASAVARPATAWSEGAVVMQKGELPCVQL